jgi:Na+-driven multidrug efflux pump
MGIRGAWVAIAVSVMAEAVIIAFYFWKDEWRHRTV